MITFATTREGGVWNCPQSVLCTCVAAADWKARWWCLVSGQSITRRWVLNAISIEREALRKAAQTSRENSPRRPCVPATLQPARYLLYYRTYNRWHNTVYSTRDECSLNLSLQVVKPALQAHITAYQTRFRWWVGPCATCLQRASLETDQSSYIKRVTNSTRLGNVDGADNRLCCKW